MSRQIKETENFISNIGKLPENSVRNYFKYYPIDALKHE